MGVQGVQHLGVIGGEVLNGHSHTRHLVGAHSHGQGKLLTGRQQALLRGDARCRPGGQVGIDLMAFRLRYTSRGDQSLDVFHIDPAARFGPLRHFQIFRRSHCIPIADGGVRQKAADRLVEIQQACLDLDARCGLGGRNHVASPSAQQGNGHLK